LKKLQEEREQAELTQAELARLSGVPQPVISGIETGVTRNPRVETMRRLANTLHCTIEELLEEKEEANNE
jgi:transcriptional regulator with XRE-family HTH domain